MLKLKNSCKGSDYLSSGFDCSRGRRRLELNDYKNVLEKHFVRNNLGDVLGFAEWQQNAIYGLGYTMTKVRNNDNVVINRDNATANAKILIAGTILYIPHYTLSLEREVKLSEEN